jgi:hypothetical protein
MSAIKRKRVNLDYNDKLDVFNSLKLKSKTRNELATQYGCDLSTIVCIVQNETKIRNIAIDNGNTSKKRQRAGNYEQIDGAVAVWFRQMRSNNAVISGLIIMEKAKQFAVLLQIAEFDANGGWLSRWKTKHNIISQNTR